ncbi:hypothetical protein K438DRAFT_1971256 [Mycena galopus ATCC 62051]|nr:hypothetical protein K438DRAFT_1971256 [Mycena galopus ATCC 62051]
MPLASPPSLSAAADILSGPPSIATQLPTLTTLSLEYFISDHGRADYDIVEFILRHKATLTRFKFVDCYVYGVARSVYLRPWHAVLQRFQQELSGLRSFKLLASKSSRERFGYSLPRPLDGRADWQANHDAAHLDIPALEAFKVNTQPPAMTRTARADRFAPDFRAALSPPRLASPLSSLLLVARQRRPLKNASARVPGPLYHGYAYDEMGVYPRPWHAVLERFQQELVGLRSFQLLTDTPDGWTPEPERFGYLFGSPQDYRSDEVSRQTKDLDDAAPQSLISAVQVNAKVL